MVAWIITVKVGDSFKQKPWSRIALMLAVFGFVFIMLTTFQTATEQASQEETFKPTPSITPTNLVEPRHKREPKPDEPKKQTVTASDISANPPGEFITESYKVTVGSIRRYGTTATASVTLESLSNREMYFTVMPDCYLVDENGDRWTREGYDPARFIEAGSSIVPQTKIKSKFSFKAMDSSTGSQFTLVCTEAAPKYGRKIVIRGLSFQ